MVLLRMEWNRAEGTISRFHIQRKVRYLGTWLGNATVMEQYQGQLAKLQSKAQFLATLPMTEYEKVQALHLWAYPVLRHVALQFFPTSQVIRRANMAMRTALRVPKWDLPVSCWQQPRDKGGCNLGTAGDRFHSLVFVQIFRPGRDHPTIAQNFQALENWFSKRTKLILINMQLKYLAWSKLPQVHWPLRVTSSLAHSSFQKSMLDTGLTERGLLELPLCHTAIFSRETPSRVREMRERSCCCPRLVNRGF